MTICAVLNLNTEHEQCKSLIKTIATRQDVKILNLNNARAW
jgi:hypothetical protein